MVRKGNLAFFECSGISETRETTPTKIVVHACYINAYLHEFFHADFDRLNFFMTMDYRVEREIWPFLRASGISETREVTPTKIGVHVCYINTYLHKFFEPIPID